MISGDKDIIFPLGISPRFHLCYVLVIIHEYEYIEEAACYTKKLLNVKQLLNKF